MKQELLEDIKEHPGTYAEEISRRIGWNRQTVSNYARQLEAEGRIRVEEKGPMKMLWAVGEDNGG